MLPATAAAAGSHKLARRMAAAPLQEIVLAKHRPHGFFRVEHHHVHNRQARYEWLAELSIGNGARLKKFQLDTVLRECGNGVQLPTADAVDVSRCPKCIADR